MAPLISAWGKRVSRVRGVGSVSYDSHALGRAGQRGARDMRQERSPSPALEATSFKIEFPKTG